MKKIGILGSMFLIVFFVMGCQQGSQGQPEQIAVGEPYGNNPENQNPSPEAPREEIGQLVFTITDAAADMQAVSEVRITIDEIQVHSAAKGWVTLSSDEKTFDLLELKAKDAHALLLETDVEVGRYDQIRLDVRKVVVVDEKGEHDAKLPSDRLQIKGDLEVTTDKTATASFDFIVDESLHITGNDEYILAPVIRVETRSDAKVNIKTDDTVEITDGKIKTDIKVGMDSEGKLDVGLKIPANAKISVNANKIAVQTLI